LVLSTALQAAVIFRLLTSEFLIFASPCVIFFASIHMKKRGTALTVHENVPLAPYTTLGVGGPARFLVRARNEGQILDAMDYARARGCPVFILGRGSNVVISDMGFPGLVLKIEIPGIRSLDGEDGAKISVGAGVEWDAFVQYCVNRNLAGIECLSGIPGTVGGTPVQNVGAYGEEVSETIFRIRVLDRNSNDITELCRADCGFAYRSSVFNTIHKNRYIILSVDFILGSAEKPIIDHQDLKNYFDIDGQVPTISEVREAVLQIRKAKAMVLVDGDPDSRSVGSFFKNPVLSSNATAAVEKEARAHGLLGPSEGIPRIAAPGGKEKLPAAWFVERAGFHRGYTCGRTGISSKHALALINRGGASAQDILDLMQRIQSNIRDLFGLDLQAEPVFVGF
jgi:UDP-N-acetylmuramate dehydrogenase